MSGQVGHPYMRKAHAFRTDVNGLDLSPGPDGSPKGFDFHYHYDALDPNTGKKIETAEVKKHPLPYSSRS